MFCNDEDGEKFFIVREDYHKCERGTGSGSRREGKVVEAMVG